MAKTELDPFSKKKIADRMKKEITIDDLMRRAGENFGRRMAECVKLGLDVNEAFELNKIFCIEYGKALIQFGEGVEMAMFPIGTCPEHPHGCPPVDEPGDPE